MSRAVIEPRLSATVLAPQDIDALMRNGEWIAIESGNAKIVLIEQFAKTQCGVALIPQFSLTYSL
jgi:hypothetical protein